MATGRIGVTPVLRVRWSDQPTAGTTVLSGLDDNSVALVYDAGYEAVYRNGVLLSRGNDYTATNGTTVTLIDATLAGDVIEIFANDLVPLTDAISKGQYTAKGALLSASAASTPAVLTVGSNNQVLTADSAETTGLKWATPASGGMTLLSTTTTNTGSAYTISSLATTYNALYLLWDGLSCTAGANITIAFASGTAAAGGVNQSATALGLSGAGNFRIVEDTQASGNCAQMWIYNYGSTNAKPLQGVSGGVSAGYRGSGYMGFSNSSSAISTFTVTLSTGTFSAGTLKVYGVS